MNLKETYVSSEEIFDGTIVHLFKDTVTLPNGRLAVREVMRHYGAVCIVALTDDGKIITEKQYRYPFDKVMHEIPAGKLEPGENPLLCAKRELSEETGITAENWEFLGDYYPSVAISDEVIHMYLATNLTYADAHTDEDEFIEIEQIPLERFVAMILNGEITDGKTQTAVLKVWMKLHCKG